MFKTFITLVLLFIGSALSADKLVFELTKGNPVVTETFIVNVGEGTYNPFYRDGVTLEVIVKSVDSKTGHVVFTVNLNADAVANGEKYQAKLTLDHKTVDNEKHVLTKSYINQNPIVLSSQLVK